MSRKKSPASELNVAEKQSLPLAQRLSTLITNVSDLKDYLGVSAQAINQYKLGISRPTLENLCKIADFYEVSVDWLIGRPNCSRKVNDDITAVMKYTGLSEEAVCSLRAMREQQGASQAVSSFIAHGIFLNVVSDIFALEDAQKAAELDQFGFYSVAEGWQDGGFLISASEYLELLKYRIAEKLGIIVDDITRPNALEE